MTRVIIVGGGLSGSMLASFLAKRGLDVTLFEKRKDPRTSASITSQRTIGMSISTRGLWALKKLGLDEYVIAHATSTYGRASHSEGSGVVIQPYSDNSNAILTIDRKGLNEILLYSLDKYQHAKTYFESSLEDIDFTKQTCTCKVKGKIEVQEYDYLIAADGVFSTCRLKYEQFLGIHSQIERADIGYKEFSIPFSTQGIESLQKHLVHTWSSKDKKAILVALPSNQRQAFLVNIFCPEQWISFFNRDHSKKDILDFLLARFPSLGNLLDSLDSESFYGKASEMYQVKSNYWNYKDSFLTIGDASHGILPFYAMGMNISFESCALFEEELNNNGGDLGKTISCFQSVRKKDTDAMQEMAFENFSSIADSSSHHYSKAWNLERVLHEMFPNDWIPEYHLIAFTNIPLSEVHQIIRKQRAIIKKIINHEHGMIKTEYTKAQIYDLLTGK